MRRWFCWLLGHKPTEPRFDDGRIMPRTNLYCSACGKSLPKGLPLPAPFPRIGRSKNYDGSEPMGLPQAAPWTTPEKKERI